MTHCRWGEGDDVRQAGSPGQPELSLPTAEVLAQEDGNHSLEHLLPEAFVPLLKTKSNFAFLMAFEEQGNEYNIQQEPLAMCGWGREESVFWS